MSLLGQLSGVLGGARVAQLRDALSKFPKEELRALTLELRAAHDAARSEESRRDVVNRLLMRLGRHVGVELTSLELALLRVVVGKLVAEKA